MERKLFTECRMLYAANEENPFGIRMLVQMDEPIDPTVLRDAVDSTMQRYPYFCVELRKRGSEYVFAQNDRPVVISGDLRGVELNSENANYHMISFAHKDDWIAMDVFHGMTDGTGANEVIRTLLYYYCSGKYGIALKRDGVRLVGDTIPAEEWDDPVVSKTDLPTPKRGQGSKALSLVEALGLGDDGTRTVYGITVPEAELMTLVREIESSPSALVALLLSRSIAALCLDAEGAIRVMIYVNQRKALDAPLAHQTLVGAAFTEYADQIRGLPIGAQAAAYRKMLLAQTGKDAVLMGLSSTRGMNQLILSKGTDQERSATAAYISKMASAAATASVSYIGKSDFPGFEKHVRDLRIWTSAAEDVPLVEMTAANGQFRLDVIQPFSSPVLVDAFLEELNGVGLAYKLQDKTSMKLPGISLPWN